MNVPFMVSVIVPIYKAESYIRKCLDSILSQTFINFELLLIDDGSPDDCGKICDEYAKLDDRVRVFHKENGGVSKARNLGLDYAKGDYVCFIDSDDWVDSDMLETLIGREQKKRTDLLFYGFQYEASTRNSNTLELLRQFSGIYEGINSVVEVCYLLEINELLGWTWNKLFRNGIIQEYHIRFNEEISIQEDHIFTLEYLKYVTCLTVCAYAPYHYRMVQDSLTNKRYSYFFQKKKLLLLFQRRMELINKRGNVDIYRQYVVREFLLTLLYYYRLLNSEIENQLEELKDIRSLFRKYALMSQSTKIYILYIVSFLPVYCLRIFFRLYLVIYRLCKNRIKR